MGTARVRSVKTPAAAELDELAAAPPATFVQARDALVTKLRKAGRTREAAEIAKRRRPSVVLWLVNRLAHTDRAAVRRLLDASDRLRRAQLRDPSTIREATRQHRIALQHLTERAEHLLAEAGMHRSLEVSRRVQAILTAASADRRTQRMLEQGQLLAEVEPGGFEILGEVPARHLKLIQPTKERDRAASSGAVRASAKTQKAEERAQRQAARREAQAQRRHAARVKAEENRRQRAIDRATRRAERLREQLRAAEARIERERRSS